MCGRYTGFDAEQEKEIMEIVKEVERKTSASAPQASFKTTGEIFPSDRVPVLTAAGGRLTGGIMQWGYPGYPDRKYPNRKPRPLINAKSETADRLPTWNDSLAHRRCIIPSGGFDEWQHGGPMDKTKYLFTLHGEDALYMAGVYKSFPAPDGGNIICFSILTAAANDSMRDVHDRMPVVIRREEFDAWLNGDYTRLFERSSIELNKIAV